MSQECVYGSTSPTSFELEPNITDELGMIDELENQEFQEYLNSIKKGDSDE